jgi:putative copper export protein
MSRPDSPHVTALKGFRDRLVEARRAAAREDNLDKAIPRFIEIETAIGLVDIAITNELDLTPLPRVDDPTQPPPEPAV